MSRTDLDKLEYVIDTSTRFECQHSPVIATVFRGLFIRWQLKFWSVSERQNFGGSNSLMLRETNEEGI